MKNFISNKISQIVQLELTPINIKLDNLINDVKKTNNKYQELTDKVENFRNTADAAKDTFQHIKHDLDSRQMQIEASLNEFDKFVHQFSDDLSRIKQKVDSYEKQLLDVNEKMKNFSENIRNNNIERDSQRKLFADFSENLKNSNNELASFRKQIILFSEECKTTSSKMSSLEELFSSYSINLKNNNQLMDQTLSQLADCKKLVNHLERGIITLQKEQDSNLQFLKNIKSSPLDSKSVTPSNPSYKYKIDYLDFENHFRGPRSQIMENQRQYLQYFVDKRNVIDIGCGRGEFLELLNSQGINSVGVDFNEDCVAYCKSVGLNAVMADGICFLEKIASTDGIFAGQVVEHLDTERIMALCRLAYKKLEKGSYLVIETPNPTSLAIYTRAFFIDPSHQKPVHPLFLEYCLKACGFENTQIIYTKNSELPAIPSIECPSMINAKEFNNAMKTVSQTLFGSQDYAIVARKD